MNSPLIGLTTYKGKDSEGYSTITTMESYIQSVLTAGGIPLLIPLGVRKDQLAAILERVDGILFTGGGDIHPDRFDGKDHPQINEVDEERDRLELDLYHLCTSQAVPFFGICRGLQVINVAAGGSLYTHIADQRPDALEHRYYPGWPRDYLPHSVSVVKESQLLNIVERDMLQVNSLHHQGIERLAEGYIPSAYAPDGIIEAIELRGYPYGLAVQWHPECIQDQQPMRALFASFVQAAGEFRKPGRK
jgi:putative glutamine amidotransferase